LVANAQTVDVLSCGSHCCLRNIDCHDFPSFERTSERDGDAPGPGSVVQGEQLAAWSDAGQDPYYEFFGLRAGY